VIVRDNLPSNQFTVVTLVDFIDQYTHWERSQVASILITVKEKSFSRSAVRVSSKDEEDLRHLIYARVTEISVCLYCGAAFTENLKFWISNHFLKRSYSWILSPIHVVMWCQAVDPIQLLTFFYVDKFCRWKIGNGLFDAARRVNSFPIVVYGGAHRGYSVWQVSSRELA
jgi:hypothetical protein